MKSFTLEEVSKLIHETLIAKAEALTEVLSDGSTVAGIRVDRCCRDLVLLQDLEQTLWAIQERSGDLETNPLIQESVDRTPDL